MDRPGGTQRQVVRLATKLIVRGHEVELFTGGANPIAFPELDSIPVKSMQPFSDRYLGIYSLHLNVARLARRIQKGFDILNPHNFPTEVTAYLAKKRAGTPIAWMCNEPPFYYLYPELRPHLSPVWPITQYFEKVAVRSIEAIAVLDQMNQNRVKRIYSRDSTIVRTGVDIPNFEANNPEESRNSLGFGTDFVVLQVGTGHSKRPEDTIWAFSQLTQKQPELKLVLVGSDRQGELMQMAKRLGINSKVSFEGTVSEKRLGLLYDSADVVVFPASQTWGLNVTEAMAHRKPVIVSKGAGVAEIIEHGKNGLLISPRNTMELALRIGDLQEDQKLRTHLAGNAQEFVRCNLSWDKYADNMLALFERVVEKEV